jgi:hypothetical protein
MSQKNIELFIGRLATDEEFRRHFQADPGLAIQESIERGADLTRSEVAALVATDVSAFDRVAETLDPRLQKASLRSGTHPSPFDRRTS